jgi:4'-phosphopantetheinyl transferase
VSLQQLRTIPSGIEVWLLEFDFSARRLAADWSLLSAGEKSRAQHFYQACDCMRFVAARAALRRLLAQRVMESPDTLRIAANEYGKPFLQGHSGMSFNISHAGGFALIALSSRGEIGVDIEYCRRDVSGLHAYVLSPLERALKLWPDKDFIELWVAKEAVLKALGFGIAEYLQAITVLPRADGSYGIAHDQPAWADISAWPVTVPRYYTAALALINQAGAELEPCRKFSHAAGRQSA